jgi:ABC-type uncharacterized transport system substrate-binding protein
MTRARSKARTLCAGIAALATALASGAARAHPHVWVEVRTTVLYDNGSFTGIRQTWTFDELYSERAIEGLPTDKAGRYGRTELAELAKVNMDGLKEFDYFTHVSLAGQRLKFGEATDAYLEHVEIEQAPGPQQQLDPAQAPAAKAEDKGFFGRVWASILGKPVPGKPKVLALTFTVPLANRVLAEADAFEVATTDTSFFIWFEGDRTNPMRLSDNAPADCKVAVKSADAAGSEAQRLGEAFFSQLGGGPGAGGIGGGGPGSQTFTVRCPK